LASVHVYGRDGSAVLHFAANDGEFDRWWTPWESDRPRRHVVHWLATSIGIEARIRPLGHRRFALPDGSERYLADERRLMDCTARLGGQLMDPLKTTLVQDQRAMTTWVVRKR
jgi:hypothetical protein